jgi:hypothetical protein
MTAKTAPDAPALEFFQEEYLPKQNRAGSYIPELLDAMEESFQNETVLSLRWDVLAADRDKAGNRLRAHAGHLGYGVKVRPAASDPDNLLAFAVVPKVSRPRKVEA